MNLFLAMAAKGLIAAVVVAAIAAFREGFRGKSGDE